MSRDPDMQQAVAQVFAGIDLHVREDAVSALELISRSHFDGFIVDCDGMKHGTEIIAGVRVIFTIVKGKTSVATAMELGSNFVLGKPLDVDRLSAYFQSSLHKMETEHRRYFRYQLTLDAELVRRDGKIIPAQILNAAYAGVVTDSKTEAVPMTCSMHQAATNGSSSARFKNRWIRTGFV